MKRDDMERHTYLFHIQYLGYRYHGWLKQPGLKTVEGMVEKTAGYVLGHSRFKILGSSRTDAKVSANHSAFALFVSERLTIDELLKSFNRNLPNDIRVKKIERVDQRFNIIQAPKIKAYIYFFSFGEKCHPFSAPFICSFQENLDLELMQKGAALFKGKHNFIKYCTQPSSGAVFEREILVSTIKENTLFKASFFPSQSYAYHIHSKGFLRYQVRLIMGQLLCLGRGEIGLKDIEKSLKGEDRTPFRTIAPSSGLMLNEIIFE